MRYFGKDRILKTWTTVWVLTLVLVIYGCPRLPPPSAPTAGTRVTGYAVEFGQPTEMVEESSLVASVLRITLASVDEVNGLMRVQISAYNVTREDFQFEYRFKWMDEQGFEIPTPLDNWNSAYSIARDNLRMNGVAPNERAKQFEFLVRFPDRW